MHSANFIMHFQYMSRIPVGTASSVPDQTAPFKNGLISSLQCNMALVFFVLYQYSR